MGQHLLRMLGSASLTWIGRGTLFMEGSFHSITLQPNKVHHLIRSRAQRAELKRVTW